MKSATAKPVWESHTAMADWFDVPDIPFQDDGGGGYVGIPRWEGVLSPVPDYIEVRTEMPAPKAMNEAFAEAMELAERRGIKDIRRLEVAETSNVQGDGGVSHSVAWRIEVEGYAEQSGPSQAYKDFVSDPNRSPTTGD